MRFHSFNIGYIDIPAHTMLNIYTVGCEHNCPGCHAKDLQDINNPEAKKLTSKLILEKLNACAGFYNGVCWLGGDPLYQFDEFIRINKELKKHNIFITAYTGYELQKLNQEQYNQLVSCVDILIDGLWKGKQISDPETNQKIWLNKDNKFNEITYEELKSV